MRFIPLVENRLERAIFHQANIQSAHVQPARGGTATSLAAVTYVGFDGITTLAEDVREPKRTVPLAIVLVCNRDRFVRLSPDLFGATGLADYNTFKNLDTAFFDVCSLVGGKFLLTR